jgi:hypothetical protein
VITPSTSGILTSVTKYAIPGNKKIMAISGGSDYSYAAVATDGSLYVLGKGSAIAENLLSSFKLKAPEYYCNGVKASDTKVCSSHGTCTDYNCTCKEHFFGNNCQYTTCNGIESTNTTVCNGHGTCYAYDKCSCNDGYSGDFCDVPGCFGYSK